MRKIVILGSSAGGTMMANNLCKELDENEWEITIIDKDEKHHFQSGHLFIPFGVYTKQDVLKPKKEFIPHRNHPPPDPRTARIGSAVGRSTPPPPGLPQGRPAHKVGGLPTPFRRYAYFPRGHCISNKIRYR